MGLFGNFMDKMRIDNDDDYDYDDEDFDDAPRGGIFKSKSKNDDYDYDEPEQSKKGLFSSKNQVTPVRSQMEVAMVKPTAIEDGRTIVDALLSGKAVVLNMEGIQTELAQRILDFTSGAVYSMNGKLQMISNFIFIATPNRVELSGDFRDLLGLGSSQLDITGGVMRF